MSFVRPEVMSHLIRWREVLAGGALSLMGAWYALTGVGNISVIGIGIALAGAVLLFTGLQRARFKVPRNGPGLVELVERRVTYFGALHGASFSLDDVDAIHIERENDKPGAENMFWVFDVRGEGELRVPASAVGAEGLFDALAGFTGADYQQLIEASQSSDSGRYKIWASSTV